MTVDSLDLAVALDWVDSGPFAPFDSFGPSFACSACVAVAAVVVAAAAVADSTVDCCQIEVDRVHPLDWGSFGHFDSRVDLDSAVAADRVGAFGHGRIVSGLYRRILLKPFV